MMISPGVFSFFPNFNFLGCLWGKRAKNGPKWQNILSVALHIAEIIHHIVVIYGAFVWNDDITKRFFHLFKVLIFWVVRWIKGQKMVQNEKKFCLSRSISQEPYIIWFSFMMHMCKMIISMSIFFIFSNSWFSDLLGGL